MGQVSMDSQMSTPKRCDRQWTSRRAGPQWTGATVPDPRQGRQPAQPSPPIERT